MDRINDSPDDLDPIQFQGEFSYQIFAATNKPRTDIIKVKNQIRGNGLMDFANMVFWRSGMPTTWASSYSEWYIGLILASSYTTNLFKEFRNYNVKNLPPGSRCPWNKASSVTTPLVTSTSPSKFVITNAGSIIGFFLSRAQYMTSDSNNWVTEDAGYLGATGDMNVIWSAVQLNSIINVTSGETINVTYSVTA